MYTAGTLILCVNTWFSIVEHALSPITHCLLLIRDVTNIINYKCLSMLVEEKVSQISTVLCIWHVFHNFISNVIRIYALLCIFLNFGKMVIQDLKEMRMCLFICNLGPLFIISRPMNKGRQSYVIITNIKHLYGLTNIIIVYDLSKQKHHTIRRRKVFYLCTIAYLFV